MLPNSAWERTWSAPAKLNLCLHITGQKANGYHELETIFQLINLCDTLKFTPRTDGQILRTTGLATLAADDDLVVKAARRLKEESAIDSHLGVSIAYQKHIPVQAGLGGGSSNAATVLMVLNRLWDCRLNQQKLEEIGASLGADVPVFIRGQSAYATGIGDELTAIELPTRDFLVVKPDVAISTVEIFQQKQLTRDTKLVTIRALLEPMQANTQSLTGHNDCEKVVQKLYPEIAQIIDFLNKFGNARLTGTGSSVFLTTNDVSDLQVAKEKLQQKSFARNSQSFIVNGLNRSPLIDELAELS